MADYDWFREPRVTPEHEKWGFNSVEMSQFNIALECPLCFALVKKDYSDYKEESRWWKHILWHISNDEHWDWQPREQE
jgi:hypothetical protein